MKRAMMSVGLCALCLLLVSVYMLGCSDKSSNNIEKELPETRTITDQYGRQVEISAEVNRV